MHEYTSTVRIWELTCPGFLEEVGRVRRWIRDVLSDSPRVDDAALIVTELSTNALLHSDSGNSSRAFFSLTLTHAPDLITISVTDFGGSSSRPHIQHPNTRILHGRGLALVAALAEHLEVRGGTDGHTVIATLHHRKPITADEAVTPTPPSPEHQPC